MIDPNMTMAAPLGPEGAIGEADQARIWLGDAVVAGILQELVGSAAPGSLSRRLRERGLIDAAQQEELARRPPLRLIGAFEMQRQLGAGAMGEVWLARRVGDDLQVALKTMSARYAGNNEFIQRFEREADVIAGFNHPHIAGAIARGTHQDLPWLAMEFVHGPTLQDLLQRHGALPEEEILRLAIQVAKGLDHAWTHCRLVHRDIKPGNIIIERNGRPPTVADAIPLCLHDVAKVIDFGLAKSTDQVEGQQSMTMTGMVMGTPSYMAPEQIHGSRDLDHRADQYALGATLYHLLTNQVPYEGASSASVITAHLNAPIPDPRQRVPSLRPATAALVRTCMAKRSDERFGSWQAFIEAAQDILKQMGAESTPAIKLLRKPMVLPPSARRTPLPGSLTTGAPPASPDPVSQPTPPPQRSSDLHRRHSTGPFPRQTMPADAAPRPGTGPVTRPGSGPVTRPGSGPVPKPATGSVVRPASGSFSTHPLPTQASRGDQALAQVMTDRVQRIRHVGPRAPISVTPETDGPVPPHVATPSTSSVTLEALDDEATVGLAKDPMMVRVMVVVAVVAVALIATIILVP